MNKTETFMVVRVDGTRLYLSGNLWMTAPKGVEIKAGDELEIVPPEIIAVNGEPLRER